MRVKALRAQLSARGEHDLVSRFLTRSPCAAPYPKFLANHELPSMYMPYDGVRFGPSEAAFVGAAG